MKSVTVIPLLLAAAGLYAQTIPIKVIDPGCLPFLKQSRLVQISSYDTTGGNNDRVNIKTGETATILDMEGPGIITRIWVTIDSRDPWFLRRLVLRCWWDGEESPSVEVPVGDFFGTGFGYVHYLSSYTGMSSGGYYCYFPMPFNKSARITVENQTGREVYALYYQIEVQRFDQSLPEDMAYFHAFWKRELRTPPGHNYTVLDAEGRGHFVGLNLSAQGYGPGFGFLEGDEMVYVDDEEKPSVHGTGTEDYFNSGWYFRNGTYAGPWHGLLVKNDSLGRIAAYRFQISDAIPFRKSLRFTLEHGHANTEICDYSSTAFWYQKESHKSFPPFLPAAMRIPLRWQVPPGGIEAEKTEVKVRGGQSRGMDMSAVGPEWSGRTQLLLELTDGNAAASLTLPGGEEEAYAIDCYFTRGPEYGNVDVFCGGTRVGRLNGFSEEGPRGGRIRLSDVKVTDGKIELMLKSTAGDSGVRAGLDAFIMEPVRRYIPAWMIIGPFPNPRKSDTERFGLDTVYPPEKKIDYGKTYEDAEGQKVTWQRLETPASGYLSLWDRIKPPELVVTYAHTWLWSGADKKVPLLIGTDDGAKVFLNGRELYRFLEVRIAQPDQDKVILPLKKGWNSLLIKIENNLGGYAFYARLLDPGNIVSCHLEKNR